MKKCRKDQKAKDPAETEIGETDRKRILEINERKQRLLFDIVTE